MLSIILFLVDTFLIGFSISTDDFFLAFSYGISNPQMESNKKHNICLIFAGLQLVAILLGWITTDVLEHVFSPFAKAVPYLLLVMLCAIGLKLLIEGIYLRKHEAIHIFDFSFKGIFLQGLSSCLDALFLGMTFAGKSLYAVFGLSFAIAFVTYFHAASGIKLGKKLNGRKPYSSGIICGIVLIFVGIEIFLKMNGIIPGK